MDERNTRKSYGCPTWVINENADGYGNSKQVGNCHLSPENLPYPLFTTEHSEESPFWLQLWWFNMSAFCENFVTFRWNFPRMVPKQNLSFAQYFAPTFNLSTLKSQRHRVLNEQKVSFKLKEQENEKIKITYFNPRSGR